MRRGALITMLVIALVIFLFLTFGLIGAYYLSIENDQINNEADNWQYQIEQKENALLSIQQKYEKNGIVDYASVSKEDGEIYLRILNDYENTLTEFSYWLAENEVRLIDSGMDQRNFDKLYDMVKEESEWAAESKLLLYQAQQFNEAWDELETLFDY